MKKLSIPRFYIVSSDPDRENTEDYLRKHLEKSKFYQSSKDVNMPVRRLQVSMMPDLSSNGSYEKLEQGINPS